MALASRPSRRRGRRWLYLAVLVTLVVLAVNAAMSARSSAPARQLAEQSYFDEILPDIQSSTQQGQDIDAVRVAALSYSAATINTRLSQTATAAAQTLNAVQRMTPPKPMRTAHDLLVATLAIRVDAIQALTSAFGAALTPGHDLPSSVNAFVAVGEQIAAGDQTYQLFVKAAPPGATSSLPASVWVPDPSVYSAPTVGVLLASLQAAGSNTPIHDTAVILVTTTPGPVTVSGSSEVVPVAKLMSVQIVVADIGNQSEKNLTVSATIVPSAIGPSQMLRDFVNLAPGQRRTVSFDGLRVQPGLTTTLTVKIDSVNNERNTDDNAKVITFIMQ